MSAALTEEEARAAETAHRSQTVRLQEMLDDLRRRGVREGSIDVIKASLGRTGNDGLRLLSAVDGDPIGATLNGAEYDPVLEAYTPDPDNDLKARLDRQLKSKAGVTLEVHCQGDDGRSETVHFAAKESAGYFDASFAEQSGMRTSKIRERRLRTAIAAATRLREAGGRRAEVSLETALTIDEQLCLMEYGALDVTQKRSVNESGERILVDVVALREGWSTRARKLLAGRDFDLEPAKVREAVGGPAPRRLREWWGFDDPDTNSPAAGNRGFGRAERGDFFGSGFHGYGAEIPYGPQVTQARLSDVWDEQAKARYAYARDPMCKQGVKVASNFVVGRGFSVSAVDQEYVQPVLDEYDERHTQQRKKAWLRSALVLGDLFLWRQRLGSGRVRHQVLPAQTIWYIVTLAEDINTPLYYVQRYQTHFQPNATAENAAHYVDRIIPASDVRHFKINAELDEIRGRGEPYAALPWHLKFRNHWEAQIEKDYSAAAFAYTVFVKGNEGQVRKFITNTVPKRRPPPGSWHVFNDKVEKFDVVESDKTQPSGQGSTSNGILNVLAANYGFAKEYFGVDGSRTRGGAVVSAGPAEKSFEDRQDDWGEFLTTVYQDVVDEAVAYDLIPTPAPGDAPVQLAFSLNFPDIIKADSVPKVQLIVVGRAQGFISHQTGARLYAAAIDIGDTYDYDAEQKQIADEKSRGIELPGMPPNFDTIDPKTAVAPGAGDGDPRSAPGATQIRNDDQNADERRKVTNDLDDLDDYTLAEALSSRGAVVVMN